MRPDLPPALVALLETDLDSLEKLELLRHLTKHPEPATLATLCDAVPLSRELVQQAIEELLQARYLKDGDGRIGAGRKRRNADVDELLALYEKDHLAVISALSAIAVKRIRGMAARTFAQAFVIKRPSDDDEE